MAIYSLNISENITFSEDSNNITSSGSDILINDDVFGFSDTIENCDGDGIKITDTARIVYTMYASDVISISDAIEITSIHTSSDILGINDSSVGNKILYAYANDGININDIINDTDLSFSAVITDGFTINDSCTIVFNEHIIESIGFSDTILASAFRTSADIINFGDETSCITYYTDYINDGFRIAESKKFIINVNVADTVLFTDLSDNYRLYGNTLDQINLVDTANVYQIYPHNNTNILQINDTSYGIISPYIKRLADEFTMYDNCSIILHTKPSFHEIITISDSVENKVISRPIQNEIITINDDASSGVYYITPQISNSVITLNDSVSNIVSRYKEVNFTNAYDSSLGTSENDIYTTPSNFMAEILNISFAYRKSAPYTSIKVSIFIKKYSSVDEIYLVKDIELNYGQSFVINNKEMSISSIGVGDILTVVGDTNTSFDVYIAIAEIKN